MSHQIPVEFSGPGHGIGELTWGQRQIWRAIKAQGSSEFMGGVMALPDGVTVANAALTLGFSMSRHQSLRTRLVFDEHGEPRQRLFESGTIPMEIVEAGDDDPATVAEEIRNRYESTDFDYANEWPVRLAVICRDGVPSHSVGVYSHLVIDAGGLDALLADLATMDSATGTSDVPVTATQPLEQARQQATPAARRQTEAALRHWERVLRAAAPRRFGESADHREPRYWKVRYTSTAAERAMRAIAARIGSDTSPVLLAGYAIALVRTVGTNPVVLQIAVNNRFRPGFADSVSALAQTSPCLIDVDGVTFDEAVGRAWQSAMTTYLNAYYEPNQRAALVAAIQAERGEEIDLGCYFNDRRDTGPVDEAPTEDEIRAALPASRLTWDEPTAVPQPALYLHVDDVPDGVEFSMTADTHHLSPADMETVVRTLESVVVEAAVGERASV